MYIGEMTIEHKRETKEYLYLDLGEFTNCRDKTVEARNLPFGIRFVLSTLAAGVAGVKSMMRPLSAS